MNKSIIGVLGVLSCGYLQAKCASEGLTVSPNQEIIPRTCLWIEGYGQSQQFVESINFVIPAFLESETGERIMLNTTGYNQGAFGINQSILQPEQSLTAESTYTLVFENLESLEYVPRALQSDNNLQSWTVNSATTASPTQLLMEPKFIQAENQFYGCGPAATAEFEFITDSDTPARVKTQLMSTTDGSTHTYFLTTNKKDRISIGHGMCSGAFRFDPKHEYQVRFSIMNECNTLEDDWTDWISFDNPFGVLE